MAEARRSHPYDEEVAGATPRMQSIVVHPTRLSSMPDSDGFHPVHSRRRWRRRPAARQRKSVPEDLIGLCFNCLRDDHVKADCLFPSCCRTYRHEATVLAAAPSAPPSLGPSSRVRWRAPAVVVVRLVNGRLRHGGVRIQCQHARPPPVGLPLSHTVAPHLVPRLWSSPPWSHAPLLRDLRPSCHHHREVPALSHILRPLLGDGRSWS
jgi:hypothetical protein